ncbi:hypothetical protein EDC96DRAFT_510674 [Choanephora cucurbitarum]|nr:hypothetical protein EDC96DRAFT_510674 [Choanephora cucurbitarum]
MNLRHAIVCITNENCTLQKCANWFNKLNHTKLRTTKQDKVTYREIIGCFICYSLNCSSVRNHCNTSSRDKLSVLLLLFLK